MILEFEAPQRQLIWSCACGSTAFYLNIDKSIECYECESIVEFRWESNPLIFYADNDIKKDPD